MQLFQKNILRFLPIVWLLTLALLIFGKTLFPPAGQIIFGSDLMSSHYFKLTQMRQSLFEGVLPFWNPYSFSGIPLLANPNIGSLFYPFNIIFFLLPLPTAVAMYEMLHVVFAGITMYWLLRQHIDKLSAVAGATVFAFSGYMAGHTYMGQIELIAAMAYIPLIFGLFQKLLIENNKRYFILAIGALTLQILLGSPITVMFTLELVGLYVLFRLIQMIRSHMPISTIVINIILCTAIIGFAFGLTSVELFPVAELSSQSIRANGVPYEFASRGALEIWQFPLFVDPFIFGHPIKSLTPIRAIWPDVNEFNYFIGIIPLVIVGIFMLVTISRILKKRRIDSMVLFCLIAMGFFFITAFGDKGYLYQILYQLVPFSRFFRIPVRNLSIVILLASILFGWACSQIKITFVRLLLIGIAAFELLVVYKTLTVIRPIPDTYDRKTINYIKNSIGDARVYPRYFNYQDVGFFFHSNEPQRSHIFSIGGYNELILERYFKFFELMNSNATTSLEKSFSDLPIVPSQSPYLDFLSVKYVINSTFDDDDLRDATTGKFQLVKGDNDFQLYENTIYLPRFFLVPKIIVFDNQQKLEDALYDETPDLKNSIVITRGEAVRSRVPENLNCDINSLFHPVQTLSYTPTNFVLAVESPCDAVLSTSETYYPGWHARVDGKEVPVILSNLAFRAVMVPQGTHRVEMYYSPDIYIRGILVSLGTLVILFALYIFLPASLVVREHRPQ